MQPFKPTHRITVTKHGGLITAKESFTVMLVDGAAYTEVEWEAETKAAWERTDAGEWRYMGDVAAFAETVVEPLEAMDSLTASVERVSTKQAVKDYPGLDIEALIRKPIVERAYAHDLLKQGGAWLGAARNWLKWHKHNGSNVTWGSADELRPPFTARDVDEIAAEVAAALLSDQGDQRRVNEKLCKAQLDAEIKLDPARKLARQILDRSRSEDECNTSEDAVTLAKLVLGEE